MQAESSARPEHHARHDETGHANAGAAHEGMHGHHQMLAKWIWRDFANIILGVWLIASPFTFGYRGPAMAWSDIVSGTLIVALGVATLFPRLDLARWGICFTGLWLLFAPLLFWTPSAGAYANDTLVGAFVIAFSVLIPMMPGKGHHEVMMLPGPDVPPGWSYNPSDWVERGPIIAMAFVGSSSPATCPPINWDTLIGRGTRSSATARNGCWTRRCPRLGRSPTRAWARCRT